MERPQAGYLEAGIHELRVIAAGDQHRILYFFSGRAIIATNAFLKKTDRVPAEETLKAKTARADWLRREKGE